MFVLCKGIYRVFAVIRQEVKHFFEKNSISVENFPIVCVQKFIADTPRVNKL
jgi:hypothetical protein